MDEILKNILDGYAKGTFQSEFGLDYGNVPPGSYRARGVNSALIMQNTSLCYIPDTKIDDLESYAERQVLGYFVHLRRCLFADVLSL